ncbi:MAG TPA: FtsH protease activity modulator HflK [Verrucomicrobium sp.]|nr:FtsH protease activity modulator HflK [Verrucomicrobium sp.]
MSHPSFPPRPPEFKFKLNLRLIGLGLTAFLVLIGLMTSFYTIPAESVGVVQRFGRYLDTSGPGLRFRIPFGVDQVTEVPIQRQLKMEFGFASASATNEYQNSREAEAEKSMVTGDLNAAEVEWVVQYGVTDARAYLFHLRAPESTLRDVAESVMREVVGDRTVDEVLTFGREEIQDVARTQLVAVVDRLGMGLRVEQVQLTNVRPPRPVQKSFDEVSRAQQEREQLINQANGEYNKVVPKARGSAEQKISEAEGYAVQRVNEAEGDVTRFKALLTQYEKAPEVTRQRLYLETMAEVIPQLGGKIILDEEAKQFLPLMHLQQLQPKPAPAPAPVPARAPVAR